LKAAQSRTWLEFIAEIMLRKLHNLLISEPHSILSMTGSRAATIVPSLHFQISPQLTQSLSLTTGFLPPGCPRLPSGQVFLEEFWCRDPRLLQEFLYRRGGSESVLPGWRSAGEYS